MQLNRGWHNLRAVHHGCVATIGNFDGVHLGHQAIFTRLRERARQWRLPAMVVIFEPQSAEYFAPARAPARLTRLREKLAVLAECGIDRVQCLRFGAELAAMPAGDFVRRVLVEGLGVRYLAVGDDFRFGAGRTGDFATLRAAGDAHGFVVEDTPTVSVDGARVSSTRVREALADGHLEQARRLLGRRYRICGRVVHGDERGRTLGFPTANIALHRRVSPLRGVFLVSVDGIGPRSLAGVANVGHRPTVGGVRHQLEVHLLGFDGDLYGRHLTVAFESRLRDERKFDSLQALRDQIERDVATALASTGLGKIQDSR